MPVLIPLVACAGAQSATPASEYPPAPRGNHVDTYHGRKVADPYRWLEDLDAPATTSGVEAQNKLTFGFLESLPQRAQFRDRLTRLWNYERIGVPFKGGGR